MRSSLLARSSSNGCLSFSPFQPVKWNGVSISICILYLVVGSDERVVSGECRVPRRRCRSLIADHRLPIRVPSVPSGECREPRAESRAEGHIEHRESELASAKVSQSVSTGPSTHLEGRSDHLESTSPEKDWGIIPSPKQSGYQIFRKEIIARAAAYPGPASDSLASSTSSKTQKIAMRGKLLLLLFALLSVVLLADAVTKQRRRLIRQRTTTTPEPNLDEMMNMLEADEMAEEAAEDAEVTVEDGRNVAVGSKRQRLLRMDPCMEKRCGAGRVCKVTEDNEAECVCIDACDEEHDPRRRVCTKYNDTFGSDCEVYQARCFCDTGDVRCRDPKYQHVHIEYYGECREMPECKEEDMADFPRRMRDWLFNIMRDLADRQELPSHYLRMQREAETNHTLRWTNAAIWKWCDLDGHPHDRAVSRHELFPIRAPLMALEHCIAPFLDSCDVNDDHKITLHEWGKCLQLDEDDLDDKCDELAEAANEQ